MGIEHIYSSFEAEGIKSSNSDGWSLNQHDSVMNSAYEPAPYFENKSDGNPVVAGRGVTSRSIYREDVVRNSRGLIGVVMEVAGDSDSDSSTSDGNSDDETDGAVCNKVYGNCDSNGNFNGVSDDNKRSTLPTDHIQVVWIDDSETTQNVADVSVCDRGFLLGDFVAAASDPTGQVGVVVDVNISVDLETSCGSVIKDVSTKNLTRVRELTIGDYVICGPWLGRVDDIFDNVTVLFDDGSLCKVLRADPLCLKPVSSNAIEDVNFPYYPGQRIRASSSSVFKSSRWLCGSWKANRLEAVVTKVTAGSAFIYWIACAGYGSRSYTSPPEEQNPKDLKLLSHFTYTIWQLGDRCLLPSSFSSSNDINHEIANPEIQETGNEELENCGDSAHTRVESVERSPRADVDNYGEHEDRGKVLLKSNNCSSALLDCKENVSETLSSNRRKIRTVVIRRDKKSKRRRENFEAALRIVNIKTAASVGWQDGTVQHGLDSKSLLPIENLGDHEFLPERYVLEKASDDGDDSYESRRVGIVASVNAMDRTACVRWLKPVSKAEDSREFDKEEVVSVYELEGHPDYDYCHGDVVVRLSPVFVDAQTIDLNENNEDAELAETNNGENASGTEAFPGFSDLSWVGSITDLRNGDIEVTWADGMVSTVGPQAIYVVGRTDDESVADGSEVNDDATSWETVDDEEKDARENDEESVGDDEKSSGRNGSPSFSQAAFGFFAKLASGIFSRGAKPAPPVSLDPVNEREPVLEEREACDEATVSNDSLPDSSIVALGEAECCHTTINSLHATGVLRAAEEADSLSCYDDYILSFRRFDIVNDPLDHYFLAANGQANAGKKWLRKVQKDWNILQNNLPDGICVRVYEDHMDLLRAVIVGAYGTPYQDGLFFFDFHLPQEYPDVPPSAHYHSGGWRINPNLYEEGKVCLSLLNTWTGRGNEVWDPSSSSILQVLVSLQGLVLNSKPYFNEAGYDKQIGTAEGEKNSLSYNENTFLLNLKTMMHLLRRPPKAFEAFVKGHFKQRGSCILRACDAYSKGYLIGSLTKDAAVNENNKGDSNSLGFKLMLAKIVPKLFSLLHEIGVQCEEFKHLQQA